MLTKALRRFGAVSIGASLLLALSVPFSAAWADDPNHITIKNFMFMPMSTTVKTGSTVTWKNLDGEPHTVVDDQGRFRSSALDQDDTFQFKFDKPGVYKVFCGIHPTMKATITVQ